MPGGSDWVEKDNGHRSEGAVRDLGCRRTDAVVRRWMICALAALLASTFGCPALAQDHDHDHAGSAAGEPGVATKATPTVTIASTDAMRFEPGSLRFARGDVVRLRIVNAGKLPHEFVLGTADEIDRHAAMMRQMPGMQHDEANAVRVDPGRSGEIVWRFDRAGRFVYACLVPGHFEAGMRGTVEVVDRKRRSGR